jgi:ELWxxDGT repeat protein
MDIWPGIDGSEPRQLTEVNGTLFFVANDGASGIELWKSDGTEAGTMRVKDIWPGTRGSELFSLSNVSGTLYFSANDGVHGEELWKSDGTEAGTVLVLDMVAGSGGSAPGDFIELAGKLWFSARDELYGSELRVVDLGLVEDDRNQDGVINLEDLESLCEAVRSGTAAHYQLDNFWARQDTAPGDANFDHRFDSADLASIFQRGKFETNAASSWIDGDWNCDGVFDTADLVAAFQRGAYRADDA